MNMISYEAPEIKRIDLKGNRLTVKFSRPVMVDTIENIEVLDENKNAVSYQIFFDSETDSNGNEVSTVFEFETSTVPYFVRTNSSIKSYAGIAMNEMLSEVPYPNKYCEFDKSTKTVTLLSNTEYEDAYVVAAAYENGRLVSFKAQNADIKRGTNEVLFDDFAFINADTIKILVWDNINAQKPLFEVCRESVY